MDTITDQTVQDLNIYTRGQMDSVLLVVLKLLQETFLEVEGCL